MATRVGSPSLKREIPTTREPNTHEDSLVLDLLLAPALPPPEAVGVGIMVGGGFIIAGGYRFGRSYGYIFESMAEESDTCCIDSRETTRRRSNGCD